LPYEGGMDISAWLRDLGLERYADSFEANAIDSEVLALYRRSHDHFACSAPARRSASRRSATR
jgi:hypothetical protein